MEEKNATLESLLNEVPGSRSNLFQLRYFVIGSQPTIQSKLWQCVLELQTRRDNLHSLHSQLEDTKDDIELLNIEKENLESEFEKNEKIILIKKRKINRSIDDLNKNLVSIKEKIETINVEVNYLINLYNNISNKYEKIKPYDDEESQINYWTLKLQEEFNLRALLNAPLDLELIKTSLSLPDKAEVKKNVLKFLKTIDNNINTTLESK